MKNLATILCVASVCLLEASGCLSLDLRSLLPETSEPTLPPIAYGECDNLDFSSRCMLNDVFQQFVSAARNGDACDFEHLEESIGGFTPPYLSRPNPAIDPLAFELMEFEMDLRSLGFPDRIRSMCLCDIEQKLQIDLEQSIQSLKIDPDRLSPGTLNIPKAKVNSPRFRLLLGAYGLADPADAPLIVPVLRDALRDRFSHTRALAAAGLGNFGVNASSTVPDLAQALEDKHPIVRLYAARALWRIERTVHLALPILLESLKSQVECVPDLAALFLGQMGPEASAAVPALCVALQSENACVRAQAAFALGKIGPAAQKALPSLRVAIQDPKNTERVDGPGRKEYTVRSYALVAVREIGNAKPGAHPEK